MRQIWVTDPENRKVSVFQRAPAKTRPERPAAECRSQEAGALLWRSSLPAYVVKLSETHLTFTSSARPVLTLSAQLFLLIVPSLHTPSHLKSQAPVNVYLGFFFNFYFILEYS